MKSMLMGLLGVFAMLAWSQSPEEQEAMARAMEKAKPAAQHQLLAEMAGSWTAKGRYRYSPEMPWEESTSTSEGQMIMGGRFLASKVTGSFAGMAFEGHSLMGYDNDRQVFVSTWADNMGTMIVWGEGQGSVEKKEIVMMTQYKDPATGQDSKMKSVYRVKSASEMTLEMYIIGPDGSEFKNMEFTYTK